MTSRASASCLLRAPLRTLDSPESLEDLEEASFRDLEGDLERALDFEGDLDLEDLDGDFDRDDLVVSADGFALRAFTVSSWCAYL
jgi:hypothetical protein